MNPVYIPIAMMLLVLFLTLRNERHNAMLRKIIKKRKTEDRTQMTELAKRFIDKECLIYTFNGNQITGTLKEVCDGAVLIENNGTVEAVNIDFIMRLREYPKNKKGKKKSVVLD